MKELSLNILDISENSTKAGASLIEISILEDNETLTLKVRDNGCGMKQEMLESVTNPFCTTRTTRKVGLGIPFLKMGAELTGGSFDIASRHEDEFPLEHGTEIQAKYFKNHIDFTPLGDIVSTITTLIQGHPDRDFVFIHSTPSGEVGLDTRELREQLGDVPLNEFEVINWVRDYLREQYDEL